MFQQDVFQGPGTGTFTSHTFEILFMLFVAGLIGLWLGWVLWSTYRQEAEKLRIENTSLSATNTTLRQEADNLKTKLTETEAERDALNTRVQTLGWEAETRNNQFAILQSDMEKILARNRQLESELGLTHEPEATLATKVPLEVETHISPSTSLDEPESIPADLPAETPVEQPEPEPHEPATEPVAAVPADVVFVDPVPRNSIIPIDELGAAPQTPASKTEPEPPKMVTEELAPVVVAITGGPRDDLKIVEGIGPKIEQLLFNAGITTYGQLAATSVQQLKEILVSAGPRYAMHDPGTWSAQALLAANGEWENLTAYQDFLNAGKRPDKN
ncbi:MAG: hypothetical protein ACKVU2_17035 [Saprospiraceae bacterium]